MDSYTSVMELIQVTRETVYLLATAPAGPIDKISLHSFMANILREATDVEIHLHARHGYIPLKEPYEKCLDYLKINAEELAYLVDWTDHGLFGEPEPSEKSQKLRDTLEKMEKI